MYRKQQHNNNNNNNNKTKHTIPKKIKWYWCSQYGLQLYKITSSVLILFWPFGFLVIKVFKMSFDYGRTRWRMFQKRVGGNKLDIYVFQVYLAFAL
jgi:hypothetical protein